MGVDSALVTDQDATSQFLAPRDCLGQNRAEASLQRLQNLNPMVKVSATPSKSEDKDVEFFKTFDVVVATNCNKDELLRINSICRAENILFYAGDIFGFYGFSFMDLVAHEYVEEVTETKETKDDEPAGKKQEDIEKLKQLRDVTLEKMKVPVTKVDDSMLEVLFGELSPVCAIVGGVLAQEIIKAISNKDAPHNNYFFYNPLQSCGVVETIGY